MNRADINILIVEDEPVIATDIRSLLESEGFRVAGIAQNAIRAYDLLSSASPNLVIVDIHLGSGPSGIEVAEIIQSRYQLPYIFLTSFSDETTLTAAREHGPYGYIVKPFQDKTLISTLIIAWSNHQKLQHKPGFNSSSFNVVLTPQEEKICGLLCEGRSYKQICTALFISMNTLKYHVKNLYSKFNVAGRAELTALLLS